MSPFFSCTGLSVSYGKTKVLADVSLAVSRGEFVALLGPNGAGKTTLLECLAGVRSAQNGAVNLLDKPLSAHSSAERAKHFALIGREASAELALTVQNVVALGRLPHQTGFRLTQKDQEIVERCLVEQDCAHLSHRYLYSLSDGERQRVHWARALCQEPSGMLLDEATAHLDLAHRESTFARARAFADTGKAVLAVAHDLDLALRHATRVVVLHKGTIREDGPPDEALSSEVLAEVFSVDASIVKNARGKALFVYGIKS